MTRDRTLQHYDGVCEISFLSEIYNREHILEEQYLQRGIKFMRVWKCFQEIIITIVGVSLML